MSAIPRSKLAPKILIACSGFKDVLAAKPLCDCLKASFHKLDPSLAITSVPLSDGGEGFLSVFQDVFPADQFSVGSLEVLGPLGTPLLGEYGLLTTSKSVIGIVELAKLSGIEYVSASLRNPYQTTCHGAGQVIEHLYNQGIREMYLGLGGSATTDGGLSLLYSLSALDFCFDSIERPLFFTGSHLRHLRSVRVKTNEMLAQLKITLACDVNNPMLGPNGSARVFGPQKGISPEMMSDYETLMLAANDVLTQIKGKNVGDSAFSGAAGGVSGGIMAAFDNVAVKKGVEIVSQLVGLEELVRDADLVITGEGCFDSQTSNGKVVSKIRQLCPGSIIVCGLNRSEEQSKVYDLVSRFGIKSVESVHECLLQVCSEIYSDHVISKYK